MQKSERLIVCIVGMPGSGKSLATKTIKNKFNAFVVSSGDIIRDEIRRRGLKYTPESDMKISHWFHIKGRERLIAARTCEKAKKSKKKIIVLEGFRSPNEVAQLKKLLGQKPAVIAIIAGFKTRYARLAGRKRFAVEQKYLIARDKLELSHGLGQLIKKADYKIRNNGTRAELERKIVKLIKSLKTA